MNREWGNCCVEHFIQLQIKNNENFTCNGGACCRSGCCCCGISPLPVWCELLLPVAQFSSIVGGCCLSCCVVDTFVAE